MPETATREQRVLLDILMREGVPPIDLSAPLPLGEVETERAVGDPPSPGEA